MVPPIAPPMARCDDVEVRTDGLDADGLDADELNADVEKGEPVVIEGGADSTP